jgi:MFS superfamily sulfate permease-like transporter
MDLVSKPVMTGFLFGLGLTVAIGQLPKLFGVEDGDGNFFQRLGQLIGDLGDTHGWTLAIGAGSVVLLLVLGRVAPKLPASLIVLVLGIVISSAFDLASHGVDVVGELPSALPDPAVPDVSWGDLVDLIPAAFGLLIVSAEAASVSRAIANAQGYAVDVNRDLVALGGSNLLAGFASGFVQSGGASQTLAGERAGGKTQVTGLVAAGLILIIGAFLMFLFEDLPQATLGAIVVVAISGFFRVGELRRFGELRRSALLFSLVALFGVLLFGVLPGLLVAVGLSLAFVVQRLSRPPVAALARDPASGVWGRSDIHPGWQSERGVVVGRADGPLFYANSVVVKDRLLELAHTQPPARALVLDLSDNHDLDVETLDMLAELADTLEQEGIELRLAAVRAPALELLRRRGLVPRLKAEPTLDAAVKGV